MVTTVSIFKDEKQEVVRRMLADAIRVIVDGTSDETKAKEEPFFAALEEIGISRRESRMFGPLAVIHDAALDALAQVGGPKIAAMVAAQGLAIVAFHREEEEKAQKEAAPSGPAN